MEPDKSQVTRLKKKTKKKGVVRGNQSVMRLDWMPIERPEGRGEGLPPTSLLPPTPGPPVKKQQRNRRPLIRPERSASQWGVAKKKVRAACPAPSFGKKNGAGRINIKKRNKKRTRWRPMTSRRFGQWRHPAPPSKARNAWPHKTGSDYDFFKVIQYRNAICSKCNIGSDEKRLPFLPVTQPLRVWLRINDVIDIRSVFL